MKKTGSRGDTVGVAIEIGIGIERDCDPDSNPEVLWM